MSMEDKLIWETESLIGYEAELQGLNNYIAEEQRENFDFSGFTILGGSKDQREVFIQDGEWYRGLIPSNIHLKEIFELMREALMWRLRARDSEGWLKQLIKKPWRIW